MEKFRRPHMPSSPGPMSSGGSLTYVSLLDFAWKYARFTSATMSLSPLLPVVRTDNSSFMTSSGGVAAKRPSSLLLAISRATFRDRYLGFVLSPLFISIHLVDMGLYDKVPEVECWARTGKAPISTKWIDINKGDNTNPKYRSRNVAREIAKSKLDGLFAATPPLEVMKLLLSVLTTGNKGERLMVADVKRAYFHAKSKRLTYVKLPPEDIRPGEEGMCGRLNFSMYGTRDAAANWSEEYTERLKRIGFSVGKATPCAFYHSTRGLRAHVHGDDFVVVGKPKELKWM